MSKIHLLFLLFLFSVSACSLPIEQIGDAPAEVRLSAVKVGKHAKEDVERLIGTPSTISLFEEESWIYVESKERRRAFLESVEFEREVDVVTFDKKGVVKSVKKYDLEDGIDVAFDEEMTETYGKDLNVFEEIAGNFGRFPANSGRQDR